MTNTPSLGNILKTRNSTRAFLPEKVDQTILNEIFTLAQQSPSNCNVQPWQTYVVSGEMKNKLAARLTELAATGTPPNPEFDWKVNYQGVHRERQHGSAYELYGAMGIERSDKPARMQAMLRNWKFFEAPHAVFFCMEKYLGIMGAVDLGIYAETVALLLEERGLGSCMQGALGFYPEPVHELLELPEEMGVLFGMSFGYPDPKGAANKARPVRESLNTNVSFVE